MYRFGVSDVDPINATVLEDSIDLHNPKHMTFQPHATEPEPTFLATDPDSKVVVPNEVGKATGLP